MKKITPEAAKTAPPAVPALDREQISRLMRFERLGVVATVLCAADLFLFIVLFTVAEAYSLSALLLATLIAAPVLMALFAAAAAFCNLKYGARTEALSNKYILDVYLANAAAMHPERASLTFRIVFSNDAAEMTVNSFKDKIYFDFSPFGKLSAARKASLSAAMERRLVVTFCRLAERGAHYDSVSYTVCLSGKKASKDIYIIKDGSPEKRAYKIYRKHRQEK